MNTWRPQLAFNGNCRQAFECYAKLLGGEIVVMNSFGANKDHELPPGSLAGPDDKVRFAEVRFGVKQIPDSPLATRLRSSSSRSICLNAATSY